MRTISVCAVLLLLAVGCASFPVDTTKLKLGMTKDAVTKISSGFRHPFHTSAETSPEGKTVEVWEYRCTTDQGMKLDFIYFQDSVLTRWGPGEKESQKIDLNLNFDGNVRTDGQK